MSEKISLDSSAFTTIFSLSDRTKMYDTTADEMSEMKPTDSTLINDSSIIKWVQIGNNGVNMLNSRHGKITVFIYSR